jgi:CO/xanthine dehydrogenase Mo-binding subunit
MEIPVIGKTFPRRDAGSKVTGQEKYAVDYYGPNLIWAGIKRAGISHGLLKKINFDSALALPGVLAVLTHRDVPGLNRQGIIRRDQPVLIDEKARYAGDPVALVLSENKKALQKALENIQIEWEPLPEIFSVEEALRADAAIIHADHPGGNILLRGEIVTGLGKKALEACHAVVRADFSFSSQEHAYLETEAGLACLRDDGILELIISTQTPFRDRFEVAEALGLDLEKIRIIAPYCGGAFGGKDGITVQSVLALAALRFPGRPIKMWWEREESFLAGSKRHPVRLSYQLGADIQGHFKALAAEIYFDTGPYDHLGGAVMALGLEHAGGPYRIPNVDLKSWAVYTNNALSGAFRGFGVPQVNGAMEQMVDLLAQKMGISPLEIRLRNAVSPGEKNSVGGTAGPATGMIECLRTLQDHPIWQERERWKTEAPVFKRRGVGLAAAFHGMGYGPIIADWGRAKIELTREGKFILYSGVVDMGQGNGGTYVQMAGVALNQDPQGFELILPDTDRTLPSGSASASRTTYTYGNALLAAADMLKGRILRQAACLSGKEEPEGWELVPGAVIHRPSMQTISLSQIAESLESSERTCAYEFQAPTSQEEVTQDPNLRLHGIPHVIFSYAAGLACIEVDELTGGVEVKRYLSVTDCGRVINPQAYEQQMQGGIAQGLGYALYEDFQTRSGRVLTPDLATYIIPSALDLPDMEILSVEIPEPSGPFGLKGAGEIATDSPLAAVANALADAIGRRVFLSPMTAEAVLGAMVGDSSEL